MAAPEAGLTPATVAAVRRAVLAAAPAVWRDLPWRETREPWAVLVSEVMLQQTQAPRVVGPYRRFLARFPTPSACAAAAPGDVVRAWEGLGYNRRALFLHRAAAAVCERHGGSVPSDLGALRALPGVGEYTARAVAALAFGTPVGAVDTNVARLLARAVAGRPLSRPEAQAIADRLVPPDDTWRFTQALFDLGARHCTGRRPQCGPCPVASRCRWAAGGWRGPDPAGSSPWAPKPQGRFDGSDRQGRGRLVAAMRDGAVRRGALAAAAGWPADPERAERVAADLVAEGMAAWRRGSLVLA